jgi:hypothetical protein
MFSELKEYLALQKADISDPVDLRNTFAYLTRSLDVPYLDGEERIRGLANQLWWLLHAIDPKTAPLSPKQLSGTYNFCTSYGSFVQSMVQNPPYPPALPPPGP